MNKLEKLGAKEITDADIRRLRYKAKQCNCRIMKGKDIYGLVGFQVYNSEYMCIDFEGYQANYDELVEYFNSDMENNAND